MLDQIGQWFKSKQGEAAVWLLWALVAVTIAILVSLKPTRHSTYDVYPGASNAWWARQPMYSSSQDGYQYPPQFAILHTPFALMGTPTGDVVWRELGIVLLLSAIYRLQKQIRPKDSPPLFAMVSLLILPTALDSIQNGQVNIHISALMMHAAICLMQARWRAATLILTLAVALKPIAIVMLLLVAVCFYEQMMLGLVIGLVVVIAFPYLFGPWEYVNAQYMDSFTKMFMCAQPIRNTFTDLHGTIWRLTTVLNIPGPGGYQLDRKLYLSIQLLAALGTLRLCWLAAKRWPEPGRSFVIWGLAACYLMIFNPRNEDNSFIIVTPVIAMLATGFLLYYNRIAMGLTLVAITLGMTCNGWGWVMWRLTEPWFKPVLCILFAIFFVRELLRGQPLWSVPTATPPESKQQVPNIEPQPVQ